MPPVLHVPLHELPGRRPEQVLARHLGAGSRESHHILELIAESIGAAGLIARRARPHPAGEGLIEQPAVEQDVHRSIGSPHLHRAEDVVPSLGDGSQDRVEIGLPVTRDQLRSLVVTRPLPEEEHDLGAPDLEPLPLAGGHPQLRVAGVQVADLAARGAHEVVVGGHVGVEPTRARSEVEQLDLPHAGQVVEGLVDGLQRDGRHRRPGRVVDGLGGGMGAVAVEHLEDPLPLRRDLEAPVPEQLGELGRRLHGSHFINNNC